MWGYGLMAFVLVAYTWSLAVRRRSVEQRLAELE